MKSPAKTSIANRISYIAFAVIIACSIVIGIFSYVLYRNSSISDYADKALALAQMGASAINREEFAALADTMEEDSYSGELKTYLNEAKTEVDAEYFYIVKSDPDNPGEYIYVLEGAKPDDPPEDIADFGEPVLSGELADEAVSVLSTGNAEVTGVYESEGFGNMVSGFAPVKDPGGNTIAVVGVDIAASDVYTVANDFGLKTLLIALGLSIAFGFFFNWYVKKNVGAPINALSEASGKIALGDTDIGISSASQDEIGRLTNSFNDMVESTKHQTDILAAIADGDLTVNVEKRGANDNMSLAMQKMIKSLSNMARDIDSGASEALSASGQIAGASSTLAGGARDQMNAVNELSSDISNVSQNTAKNAGKAKDAARLAENIKSTAKTGSEQMGGLIHAVEEINEAGKSINKIIKVIDDIAFQTNILALNAAVEASRAGEHGKGFAVVAEEVRNLAAKSSEAASSTSALIANSTQKAEMGAGIAKETGASLDKIVTGVAESVGIMAEIAQLSEDQNIDIERIKANVQQVEHIAVANSETAEQSASAAQELNEQINILKKLATYFHTK